MDVLGNSGRKKLTKLAAVAAAGVSVFAIVGVATAQQGIGQNDPAGDRRALSENARFFGGFDFSESCIYDASRDLIVVPSMGNRMAVDGVAGPGWVSLVNHDGSTHTIRWLVPDEATGAFINEPFGTDIVNGVLYMVDRTGGAVGGAPEGSPLVAYVTMWDVATGAWIGAHAVPDSPTGFNDIAVAPDGTIYASELGTNDPDTWQLWKIDPDGTYSIFFKGAPLERPNGVAIDNDGNIVVVHLTDSTSILTFSPAGELLGTEQTAEGGNDGLVIMADGTKYVSSVRYGSVTRIPPSGPPEIIAVGIPSAASMCYDAGANQLVVPTNPNSGLVFIPLG